MLQPMVTDGLRCVEFADCREFLSQSRAFLEAREVEHNLMLGLCSQLIAGDAPYEEPPYLGLVQDSAGITLLAALRTPPYNLILSHTDDPVTLRLLAETMANSGVELPGVLAKPTIASDFTAIWRELTGQEMQLKMRQGLHQLRTLRPARPVRGRMRSVRASDAERLKYWLVAFQMEAFASNPDEKYWQRAQQVVGNRVKGANPRNFLWWDGWQSVCWVGYVPTTERVARIAPVYTLPSARGRGYASALVAAVSQRLLDSGFSHCSLYTDLANPTANALYQRLGYEPLCEIHQYERSEA